MVASCGASWASDLSDLSDSSEKGTPTEEDRFTLNLSSTDAVSKVFSRFVGKLKIRVKAR